MNKPSLFTRNDTFFGVCEGLGEDLGINSQLLRLVFAGLLFWNPIAAIGGYLAMGVFLAVLRFVFPNPQVAEPIEAEAGAAPNSVETAREADPMPLAA